MKTITGKCIAHLSEYCGPEVLDRDDAVSRISYFSIDMTKRGYTVIGEAVITVHIEDEDQILLNKIDALENSIVAIQAEAEKNITRVREKIQSLQAITYKAEA